jgi:transposase
MVRAERERARWRLHLVRHRSSLKQRVHAVLLTQGKPWPVSDLFGARGRQLLAQLGLPQPWQETIEASLRLIDELDREITECERELRRLGANHRYVPLLLTVPGISWVLAYTIAAELGDIGPFPTPRRMAHSSTLVKECETPPACWGQVWGRFANRRDALGELRRSRSRAIRRLRCGAQMTASAVTPA